MQRLFIFGVKRSVALLSVFCGVLGAVVALPYSVVAAQNEIQISGASQTGRPIAPPNDIVGRPWSWTTISGTSYRNTTTGQLASPSGMSATFTFTKDGKYKKFFYIQQRTYGMVTQSTTTENGMATFYDNGTVVLRPSQGHYLGNIGSRTIDRDMTAAERKPTTWCWEWRTEDGKRKLYIGPSASSMSYFQRDK